MGSEMCIRDSIQPARHTCLPRFALCNAAKSCSIRALAAYTLLRLKPFPTSRLAPAGLFPLYLCDLGQHGTSDFTEQEHYLDLCWKPPAPLETNPSIPHPAYWV